VNREPWKGGILVGEANAVTSGTSVFPFFDPTLSHTVAPRIWG